MSSYDIRILEVHLQDGTSLDGDPTNEQLEEADEIFYSVSWGGEEFYRWVAGPFSDLDDLASAIDDTEEFYKETTAA